MRETWDNREPLVSKRHKGYPCKMLVRASFWEPHFKLLSSPQVSTCFSNVVCFRRHGAAPELCNLPRNWASTNWVRSVSSAPCAWATCTHMRYKEPRKTLAREAGQTTSSRKLGSSPELVPHLVRWHQTPSTNATGEAATATGYAHIKERLSSSRLV